MEKRAQALILVLILGGAFAGALGAALHFRRDRDKLKELVQSAPPHLEWPPRFATRLDVSTFQKGNIHTHSTLSDGDSPPNEVIAWYRDHGYAFLALTDHNHLDDLGRYRALEKPGFTLITGEEISMYSKNLPVHVNALCTKTTIGGGNFPTAGEALASAIEKVREQGGAALVNHPNFEWALTERDLPAAHAAHLLEIWSGHPYVRTNGDHTHKSHEAIWDEALTAGLSFAGVAVDDTHHLKPEAPEAGASRPGRGFIEVFAREPTEASICDALRHGLLYASSGATLRRIVVEDDNMTVWPTDASASVEFIGEHGAVLATARPGEGGAATYKLQGAERYVRARVTQADGKKAFTNAYRVAR